MVLLFAAVWAIDIGFAVGPWRDRRIFEARSIVTITASFLAIVILLAAEAMARSRAGMILTMVSLAGVYGLVLTDRRRRTVSATPLNFLFAAAGTAFILVVQFALYRVLARFNTDPLDDLRLQFARSTIEAAWAYMPFGAGMGTFVPVYGMFEKPQDLFAHAYVNHAHDDILELWLETGIFGIALMGCVRRLVCVTRDKNLAVCRRRGERIRPLARPRGDHRRGADRHPFFPRLSAAHGGDDGNPRLRLRPDGRDLGRR